MVIIKSRISSDLVTFPFSSKQKNLIYGFCPISTPGEKKNKHLSKLLEIPFFINQRHFYFLFGKKKILVQESSLIKKREMKKKNLTTTAGVGGHGIPKIVL